MFNKIALESYISFVKSHLPLQPTIPEGFLILPVNIFDPTMEYENELKHYLVNNYQALLLEEKPWIAIVWNREVLEDEKDGLGLRHVRMLKKNITDPAAPTAQEFKNKQVLCPIEVTYFSNSFDLLEDLEEYIILFLEEADAFYTNFPSLGEATTAVKIKEFKRSAITKEPREKHGEICRLDTSLELGYWISLKKADRNLIGRGKIHITYHLGLDPTTPPI